MPSRFRFAWKGCVCGCSEGWKSRNSISNGFPLGSRRMPPSRLQPASRRSSSARRRSLRSCPDPSETGGSGGSPKTAAGSPSRNGSRSASSSCRRLADGLHVGIVEIGRGAAKGAEHDVLVRPLEIEGEADRLADARVLELLAAQVEMPALRRRGKVDGDLLALHPAFADRRKVVAGRPGLRGVFVVEGQGAVLEGFESDRALAEILVAIAVEIVLADIHRQVAAPVIRDALELDEAALLETADAIGAGAERRLESRGLEVAALPPGGGENRHAADDEMQVAAAPRREGYAHDVVGLRLGGLELGEDGAEIGMALRLQDRQREGDVLRRQPRTVVKARLGTEQEAVGQLVGRDPHRPRDEAVLGIRLVGGAGHQAVEGHRHAGGAVALEGVDVERVEGVEILVAEGLLDLDDEGAALRRLRVDVVEMPEVRRVFEVAEARQAVALGFSGEGGADARQPGEGSGRRSGQYDMTTGRVSHRGAPVFSAFAVSYHQTVGNAAAP